VCVNHGSLSGDPFEGENNTNRTGVLINKQGKLQPNIQAKEYFLLQTGHGGKNRDPPDYNGNKKHKENCLVCPAPPSVEVQSF